MGSNINKNQKTVDAMRKSFASGSTVHAMTGFNPDKFMKDNSPAAQHAKKWGAMPAYGAKQYNRSQKKG